MAERHDDPNAPLTLAQIVPMFQKMLETVVAEMRKPPVDPIKEAQKAREKLTKEQGLKEYWERKANRKKSCSHQRQNGSCAIAWATQSDGIERGFCPYCESVITPEDGKLYEELRRMNRGMMESVRYV